MKRRKTIALFLIICLTCVSLLCDCGNTESEMSESDATKLITESLHAKYNSVFCIKNLEKVNIGQNIAEYIYSGTAVEVNRSDKPFDVQSDVERKKSR